MNIPFRIRDARIWGPIFRRRSRRAPGRNPGTADLPWHRARTWPGLERLEERMMLSTFTVTSTADTGFNTLRAAITSLNNFGGASNTINFNLGSTQQTITLLSALPTITRPVDIVAGTVPGTSEPLVVINGGSAGADTNGLVLGSGSSGSSIRDLVIDGFQGDGIDLDSTNDRVTGCYIGTNGAGTAAVPNSAEGIFVERSGSGATIGGSTAGSANVISGNGGDGIFLVAPCLQLIPFGT
jgi:hypothetical protein